jgi:hypothetical protein
VYLLNDVDNDLELKNNLLLENKAIKKVEVKSESLDICTSTKNKWLNPMGSFGKLEKGVEKI